MSAPSHGPAYQALAITPSPGSRGSFRGRQSNGLFLSKVPSVCQAPSEARVPNLRSPNGCKKICDTNLRQLRGSECLTSANHDTPIYSANKRDTSTPKNRPPTSHYRTLPHCRRLWEVTSDLTSNPCKNVGIACQQGLQKNGTPRTGLLHT